MSNSEDGIDSENDNNPKDDPKKDDNIHSDDDNINSEDDNINQTPKKWAMEDLKKLTVIDSDADASEREYFFQEIKKIDRVNEGGHGLKSLFGFSQPLEYPSYRRGVLYIRFSKMLANEDDRNRLIRSAIINFSEAIHLADKKTKLWYIRGYHYSRSKAYISLGENDNARKDFLFSVNSSLEAINSADKNVKSTLNKIISEMKGLIDLTDKFLQSSHREDTIEKHAKEFFDKAKEIEIRIQASLQNIYPRSTAEKVGRAIIKLGGKCLGVVFGVICATVGMVAGAVMGAIMGATLGLKLAVIPKLSGLDLIVYPIVGGSAFALYGLVVGGPKSGWKFGNDCLKHCVDFCLEENTPEDTTWFKAVKTRCAELIDDQHKLVESVREKIKPTR